MNLGLMADELLTTTRSVRKRMDVTRPVSRETIEECLEIALQAPNGSNLNRWRWIVVDEPELVQKIAAEYRAAMGWKPGMQAAGSAALDPKSPYSRIERGEQMIDSSYALAEKFDRLPAILVPLMRGRPEGMSIFDQSSMWGSVYPALWSFCLAARERAVGTAWTTVSCMREAQICELLGIPQAKFTHIGLLAVGHYEGDSFKPAWRKRLSDILTYNGFEG